MATMEIPIFYGEEPEEWVSWMDAFIADQNLSEFETRQFSYGFIDGEAHTWYCDELSRSGFDSWEDLKVRLIQRFSTRVVEAKEQPSLLDQIKQMSSLLDRLQRRWKEEDEARKVPEKETMVSEDRRENVSFIRGKESSDDLIPELIQPLTKLVDKNENHVFLSDVVTHVVTSEKETEGEDASAAMEDPCEEAQSMELKANTKKKRKRWKKLDLQTQKCSVKNMVSEEKGKFRFGIRFMNNKERQQREEGNKENVNNNSHAYHVFDELLVREKRVKKKRKNRTKTECKMKRIKQEMGFRELLKRQKRVLQELVKWKKLKLKHKSHKRKKKIRKMFSGNYLAFIWNSRLGLELIRGNLRGCCERYSYVIVLWSYQLMQRKGLVKLNWELQLAADKRRRAKFKLKCVVHEKLLSRVKKEWGKVLDWKKRKGKHKRKKNEQKNTKEMTNETYSWLHKRWLLAVQSSHQGKLSIYVNSQAWEQEFHDGKQGYVSMMKTQTVIKKLLEWKKLGNVAAIWTFQVHKGSILASAGGEGICGQVKFDLQSYKEVVEFTWVMAEGAVKRNRAREHHEYLLALAVIYVLFGAPRPPEQPVTKKGSRCSEQLKQKKRLYLLSLLKGRRELCSKQSLQLVIGNDEKQKWWWLATRIHLMKSRSDVIMKTSNGTYGDRLMMSFLASYVITCAALAGIDKGLDREDCNVGRPDWECLTITLKMLCRLGEVISTYIFCLLASVFSVRGQNDIKHPVKVFKNFSSTLLPIPGTQNMNLASRKVVFEDSGIRTGADLVGGTTGKTGLHTHEIRLETWKRVIVETLPPRQFISTHLVKEKLPPWFCGSIIANVEFTEKEIKEKRCWFLFFNLEDKVDFKGGGNVTCTAAERKALAH